MTVAEAKAELPAISGRWQGKLYGCRVTGRLCAFACVSPDTVVDHGRVRLVLGPRFEVSWETVARCATSGRPVLLD